MIPGLLQGRGSTSMGLYHSLRRQLVGAPLPITGLILLRHSLRERGTRVVTTVGFYL